MTDVPASDFIVQKRIDRPLCEMSDEQLVTKFRCILLRESIDHFPMSDELLLCFIRARKNDLHRSLNLLRNFIKMTKNHPDLLTNLRQSGLQKVLDLGHHATSPACDQDGSRVFFLVASHWDNRKCSLDDVFRGLVFSFELLASEVETQSKGLVAILDFKGWGLYQVKHVTPLWLKKLADLVNDVFPMRFKGIHIVNEPWVFKVILQIVWPLLSAKIRNRMFFHGKCMGNLHKQVHPSCLPTEYDGWLGPIKDMIITNVIPDGDRTNIFNFFNE